MGHSQADKARSRERILNEAATQIRERVLDTADAAEGIKSFVERRAAVFQGR